MTPVEAQDAKPIGWTVAAAHPAANSPVGTPATPMTPATPNETDAAQAVVDPAPKLEDHLQKLWEVPPPDPVPVLDSPASSKIGNSAVIATASGSSPEDSPRADYASDPIARTAMNNAKTGSETWTDGVTGIGSIENSVFLPAKQVNPGDGFKFGLATIHPTFDMVATYEKTTGNGGNPSQNGFHPGAGAGFDFSMGEPELRRTLDISYTGQYTYQSPGSDLRPFTQSLAVRANFGLTKLNLGLGVTYDALSGTNRDFGGQVNQDLFTVAGIATYEISPKSNLDWDVTVPVRQYSGGTNSAGVTSTTFLNYLYTEKTQVGLGVSGGTVDAVGEQEQRYVQLLGRVTLASTEVLNFSGTFGAEYREQSGLHEVNPVFGLGAKWKPRLGTDFFLTAGRTVQSSGDLINTNYTTTNVAVGVSQRLGNKAAVSLSGGYEDAIYSPTENSVSTNRHDNMLFGQVGVNFSVTKRWTGSITYSYRNNHSNLDPYTDSLAQIQFSFVY